MGLMRGQTLPSSLLALLSLGSVFGYPPLRGFDSGLSLEPVLVWIGR